MIGAVVAELHLVGARAGGERHDLVAEADAEGRHAALDELARRRDRVVARLGIAGAVGEEDAVGLQRETSAAGVCAGTTVIRQPRSASMRRMLNLTPKS